MLNINIICVGKIKEKYLKDAIEEYRKRLSKYCKLNITELSDEKIPDKLYSKIEQEIKTKECNNIINYIKKQSFVIALDLKGKNYSSEEFSTKLDNLSITNSHITFLIGGSLGMSDHLLNICNESICFSKMTFPHQLIRLFLVEQVFRAFKISNNEIYHH